MTRHSYSETPHRDSPAVDETLPGETLFDEVQWHHAMDQWRDVLGVNAVIEDEVEIDIASRSAIPRAHRPGAILRPQTVEQISSCLKTAHHFRMPVYPISRGKNWGYGSACPATAGQVQIDLSHMDRILEINEELGYAVVEPGVSQGQLAAELERRGSEFMLDVTGAGPDASIVGNTLERGFGHTPYGDHFQHSCGMQVVLPSGEVIETGFGGFEGAKAKDVFPWGLGPWIDGLFSQSNLGVVTRMTVWLMRRPEKIQAFAIRLLDESRLPELINTLRELRMRGVLHSSIHVANDLRVISALMGCPGQNAEHREPLSREDRKQLCRETATGAWNVLGAIYGDRRQVAWARREINRHLSKFARPIYFDDRKVRRWEAMGRWVGQFDFAKKHLAKLASARSALDLVSGVPTPEHLRGAFWRNSSGDTVVGSPDRAGLMWLSPVIPMTGDHADRLLAIVEPSLQSHGFDPLITLTSINERAMCAVISINYDRQSSEEAERAERCYKAMWSQLMEAGYPPYRAGIQSMEALAEQHQNQPMLQSIKRALDPANILAPGRYIAS